MPRDFIIDDEARAFFEQNGYLVIPDVFSQEELTALQTQMNCLIDNYFASTDTSQAVKTTFSTELAAQNDDKYFLESGDKISFFFEDDALDKTTGQLCVPKHEAFNKVAHALHDLDPVFERFSYQPAFLKIAKELAQFDKANIIQSMMIFKSKKCGGKVHPHQDSTFLQTDPVGRCIGNWIALQDATKDNGCMYFVPGSHKAPLERFFNLNDEGNACTFNKQVSYDHMLADGVPVEVKAGSIVIIHGQVVHFSHPNTSNASRNAYTFHVIDGNAEYCKTNWLRRSPDFPFRDFETVSAQLFNAVDDNKENK